MNSFFFFRLISFFISKIEVENLEKNCLKRVTVGLKFKYIFPGIWHQTEVIGF